MSSYMLDNSKRGQAARTFEGAAASPTEGHNGAGAPLLCGPWTSKARRVASVAPLHQRTY